MSGVPQRRVHPEQTNIQWAIAICVWGEAGSGLNHKDRSKIDWWGREGFTWEVVKKKKKEVGMVT
jgi:hypothetical protein